MHHWLEPVVGEAELAIVTHGAAPHPSHSTEYALIGAAVTVAAIGILLRVDGGCDPNGSLPKRESPEEQGFERVLVNKYYVDEAYDRAIVQPTVVGSRVRALARDRRRPDRWRFRERQRLACPRTRLDRLTPADRKREHLRVGHRNRRRRGTGRPHLALKSK
jgi:hypothetical protein